MCAEESLQLTSRKSRNGRGSHIEEQRKVHISGARRYASPSFITEHEDRIDATRASGWNPRRDQGHGGQSEGSRQVNR